MYEIRMQWILTWNEMKLHMHQYVCRTNADRLTYVNHSPYWILIIKCFRQSFEHCKKLPFQLHFTAKFRMPFWRYRLTYVFLHEIPQYEKIFVRCSTMHGGLQAGSTLPDPPSELRSELTIFVQKGWGIFVI